ncbi:hypothetical protein BJY00DRAFT_284392 [Aspergillus carlsbadensis]|nr:hypothetical protein BJY00DRAFT_284392 [Aspergillus carlsbadensis]
MGGFLLFSCCLISRSFRCMYSVAQALMWTHGAGSRNEDNDLELFRARLSYIEFFGGKQYIHSLDTGQIQV